MIRQDLLRVLPVSDSDPAAATDPVAAKDTAALALIGDKRNDENKIVAQFQVIMITLHNKIYEDDDFHPGITDAKVRFDHTVKLVRWHYQWVVLKDFLIKKLLMKDALIPFDSIYHPHLPLYGAVMANGRTFPFMPVEFSGAVYRLGHSMVRPSYSLNTDRTTLPPAPGKVDNPRIATFGEVGRDLRGFGERITKDWAIDWGFFVDGVTPVNSDKDRVLPQPSYRIDTRVGDPLSHLPEFEKGRLIEANLAYRNLSRAVGLALPTGEEMAGALNIEPMTTAEVWSAGSRKYREEDKQAEIEARRAAMKTQKFAQHFAHRTPLWYYILREAEFYGCERNLPKEYLAHAEGAPEDVEKESRKFGGLYLGPVGSHVVLETFLALLWHDRRSFVHDRCWQPHHKLNPSGDFTLGKLINYALA